MEEPPREVNVGVGEGWAGLVRGAAGLVVVVVVVVVIGLGLSSLA